MSLQKSEKARFKLSAKLRTLNVRERGALFLADGIKTRVEIQRQLLDDGSILEKLISEGYLVPTANSSSDSVWQAKAPASSTAAPFIVSTVVASSAPPPTQSDDFSGKRSLATTRMFLFDICERMFVRKAPLLANQFRDQLRDAKDRDSLMAVAREIINKVEEIAGYERADGLGERIAVLLPAEE